MTASDRFRSLSVALLTYSNRHTAADNPRAQEVAGALERAGHRVTENRIAFGDEAHMRQELRALLECDVQVVIGIGGTGVLDPMPEAAQALLDREITGFGQMFQTLSLADVGSSGMMSRALAGVAGGRLLFLVPGSRGGCRLALERLILPQLDATTKPCALVDLVTQERAP